MARCPRRSCCGRSAPRSTGPWRDPRARGARGLPSYDRRARVRRAEVDADDRAGAAGDPAVGGQAEVDARRGRRRPLDAVGRGEVRLRGRGGATGGAASGRTRAGARVDAGVPSGRGAMGAGATTPGDAAALLRHHPLDERARGLVEPVNWMPHPGRATRWCPVLRLDPADHARAADRRLAAGEPQVEDGAACRRASARVRMKTPPAERFTPNFSTNSSSVP